MSTSSKGLDEIFRYLILIEYDKHFLISSYVEMLKTWFWPLIRGLPGIEAMWFMQVCISLTLSFTHSSWFLIVVAIGRSNSSLFTSGKTMAG